jgi:voltage-gated potassium channel
MQAQHEHPSTKLSEASTGRRWFESAIQCLILYSIVIYYLETELSDADHIQPGTGFWLWNERLMLALFGFEYLFRWQRSKRRLRYPFTLLAAIDLLAILPSLIGLAANFRALKLVRTLRILRLFKLYRYNTALQNVMSGFRKVKDELAVIGFVVVIMVMFSSVAIYECEHAVQPDKFRRLSDAVWWSFATLTTVGYGDLYPVTLGGRVIAIITMIVGIGIFGTFISLIGSSFLSTMRSGQTVEQNIVRMPHRGFRDAYEEDDAPWARTGSDDA